ncbi:hypothetical protein AC578_9638 [Pseudocercospora eumusae]|uniref:Uncharacterized protein n=1 Tax=Pseudocercospora eumusae TaxID=321146 RepID=A0A139H1F8_9PEZI|nr:hypothetical protein AC578_9638 [Pseudocercospora eumusae]
MSSDSPHNYWQWQQLRPFYNNVASYLARLQQTMDKCGIFRYSANGRREIRITSIAGLLEATVYVCVFATVLWSLSLVLLIMLPITPLLAAVCLPARSTDPLALPWAAWYEMVVWAMHCISTYVRGLVASVYEPQSSRPALSRTEERRWQEAKACGLVTDEEFKNRSFGYHAQSAYGRSDSKTPHRPLAKPRSRRSSRSEPFTPVSSSSTQTLRPVNYDSQDAIRFDESDDEQLVWMAQTFARNVEQAQCLESRRQSPEDGPSRVTSGRNSRSMSPVLSRASLRPGSSGSLTQRHGQARDGAGTSSQNASRPSSFSLGQMDNDYFVGGDISTTWPTLEGSTQPRTPLYGHTRNASTASLASVPEVESEYVGGMSAQRPSRKRTRTGEHVRTVHMA